MELERDGTPGPALGVRSWTLEDATIRLGLSQAEGTTLGFTVPEESLLPLGNRPCG